MIALAAKTGVFELLLLLDGITALDHRAAEGDPVEEIVVGVATRSVQNSALR
jgi:hypothetical protein